MAIPVKVQYEFLNEMDVNDGMCWRSIVILCDGSIYCVDEDYRVYPVNRSYAGHIIKTELKEVKAYYNGLMRQASIARHEGDLTQVDMYKRYTSDAKDTIKDAEKLWRVFKSMSTSKGKNKNDVNTSKVSFEVYVNPDTQTVRLDDNVDYKPQYIRSRESMGRVINKHLYS